MEKTTLRSEFDMATTIKKKLTRDDYFELVQRFPLAPIRSYRQLKEAHAMIDELTLIPESKLTRGQSDYLEVLGDLASNFEMPQMNTALASITGLDVLKHLLEANELSASDLGRILGQRELGSKILRGDRQISRSHAKALGKRFSLPAETFLR
jgi:antitoxin component HigA of HigAB toxin-antitoxin module